MEVGAERGERDAAERSQQYRLGSVEGLAERAVHRLLDQAVGRIAAVADRQPRRRNDRLLDVAQRHRVKIARQRPAAAMPLAGMNQATLAQPRQGTADHDRIGPHRARQHIERRRPSCSARCSSTWRMPDRRLLRIMQLH